MGGLPNERRYHFNEVYNMTEDRPELNDPHSIGSSVIV